MTDSNETSNKNEDESKANNVSQAFLSDLTDGRSKGDWKSRYDEEARKQIHWERNYLVLILLSSITVPFIVGILSEFSGLFKGSQLMNCKKYIFAWFGGTLGGTLFAVKWLIHGVAKNTWNLDRRLWRIFTPHLSGGLGFVIILLMNCEVIKLTSPQSLTIHKCFGIGFLVGYFSDNAIGKLTEIAQVLFESGVSKGK